MQTTSLQFAIMISLYCSNKRWAFNKNQDLNTSWVNWPNLTGDLFKYLWQIRCKIFLNLSLLMSCFYSCYLQSYLYPASGSGKPLRSRSDGWSSRSRQNVVHLSVVKLQQQQQSQSCDKMEQKYGWQWACVSLHSIIWWSFPKILHSRSILSLKCNN